MVWLGSLVSAIMAELKNPQHELFCLEYLKDLNATKAAERASYSKKTARQQGSVLLSKPDISARLAELLKEKQKAVGMSAEDVIRELSLIASSDIKELFEPTLLTMRTVSDIPENLRRCIQSVEFVEEFEGSGRDKVQIGWTRKIKLWSKDKALENLGRYHKLFVDKLEVTGLDGLAERLKKSRERARTK